MIQVENLHFTYPGNKQETIKGLNFTVHQGEIFGFLGPSGAGKSTTQKIIIGILQDYLGSIHVLGDELKTLKSTAKSAYYERIGVAFEFPNLYSKFTALENLEFFRALYAGETEHPSALLNLVGLEKDARIQVGSFSKGMKTRLNFCRALLNKPELVFLDEPTTGLDPVNAKKIKEIILDLKAKGKTVLLTTHNMKVAEDLCDRVAFIIDGKINLIDSPRELKIKKGKRIVRVEYKTEKGKGVAEFSLEEIGSNQKFISLLKTKPIETIHTQEATLEEIFIEVTGRSLS